MEMNKKIWIFGEKGGIGYYECMNSLELTSEENIELEKRGFLVRNPISFTEYILNYFYNSFLFIAFQFIYFITYHELDLYISVFYYIVFSIWFIWLMLTNLAYIFLWKQFILSPSFILAWKVNSWFGWTIISIVLFIRNKILWWKEFRNWWRFLTPFLFIGLPLISSYVLLNIWIEWVYSENITMRHIFIVMIISSIVFYSTPFIAFLFRKLIEYFHPLYAFWNLWEKIQKLTPEFEKRSREIRSNFEKDMNFSVLSSWFDSLSTTFSKIISLVIRLERVEKKANKWNLFDSEKYINSLRSDILEPLKSLRAFLIEQRQKLIESQKELSRVRVGADPSLRSGWQRQLSGWQEQSELASKRSEKLIIELGENIEKLDVMIGKIG